MKGSNKKKSAGKSTLEPDLPPNPQIEDEIVPDDLASEEQADGEGGETEEMQEGGGDEDLRPQLPKGFYEMEAVRDKRVRKKLYERNVIHRKAVGSRAANERSRAELVHEQLSSFAALVGKTQYLVKWRGYPETANTWEPKQNLVACLDIVKAFEDSFKLGKHSTARRGKRKSEVTESQAKKKKQQRQSAPAATTYDMPAVRVRIIDSPLPMAPLDESDGPASQLEGSEGPTNGFGESAQAILIRCEAVPTLDKDVKVDEPKETSSRVEKCGSVLFAEEPPKIYNVEHGLAERPIGSRRRKSGSVKKFTVPSGSPEPTDEQNGKSLSITDGPGRFEVQESKVPAGSLGHDLNHENECGFPKSVAPIIGIKKVVAYDASLPSVTFRALRSDGKEVLVDNKYLKTENPLLLINFYEEHLSYNSRQ